MAVDRGGLQYTIKVRDEFSKTTARFKSEMRTSKAAFAEFQKGVSAQRASAETFRKTSKAIDEQQQILKKLAAESKSQTARERELNRIRTSLRRDETRAAQERLAAERKANKESEQLLQSQQRQIKALIDTKRRAAQEAARIAQSMKKDEQKNLLDQQKQLKVFADAETKRQKEAARISAAMKKDQEVRKKSDPENEAQRRINQGLREELVQRKQINLLRARAQTQFAQGDILGGAQTLKQAKALEKQLKDVDKAGNSIFFTFRRLVGILAVFTIARNAVQGFQDMVSAGIAFNDRIEGATTSIAGLLVAVSDVRDEFGQTVPPAEELGLAMGFADDQVKKLRQDALRTVATFQQLLETFQVAVAPGFAAGLNLDEIRKLTVSISQAASAIGVEQNQLAEEIRSLLSGTIQARTTRIATALGITNEDIRRLKETGELFNFLEERFSGFAVAAERQSRRTLSGITTLIQGAVEELLGEAAKPLFDELVSLGNQFFDQIITIRDAEGNLKPNPEIVKGFQEIFNALKSGVETVRTAFSGLGFEGLQNLFKAAGLALTTALQFGLGFAQSLLVILNQIVVAVKSVGDFFGLTTKQIGRIAGVLGAVIAATFVWNNTVGLLGVNFKSIFSIIQALIPGMGSLSAAGLGLSAALKSTAIALGQIGVVLAVVIVGFDQLLGSIFDVNLSLTETVSLIGKGIAAQVKESVKGLKALAIALNPTLDAKERGEKLKALADEMRADNETFTKEIADIIGKAASRETRGPGFDVAFDFKKKLNDANKAGKEFKGIISGVDAEVNALATSLFELDQNIAKAGEEFRVAFNSQDLQGIGAQIQAIFSGEQINAFEKLRKLRRAQETVEKSIATLLEEQGITAQRRADIEAAASTNIEDRRKALKALNLTDAEAQLVSLLRDQKDIRAGITDFEQQSVQLAQKKAAILAVETSRELNREAILTRQNLAAEKAITQVVANRLGQRRLAVVEAENALNLAKLENEQNKQALQNSIDFVKKKLATPQTGANAPTAAEVAADQALLASLQTKLGLEQALSAEKEKQLEIARQEAALVESGSLGQGISRGFEQLAEDLPTAFEAGIAIVKQSTEALTSFISSSIVAAFDPTDDTSLTEKFARFLQGIANIILQQIIQLGIQAALQKTLEEVKSATIETTAAASAATIKVTAATTAASLEIAAATTAAGIRVASGGFGFHKGGLVKGYNTGGIVGRTRKAASIAHAHAKGFAKGGFQRPASIHPSDTVPAWLQPGEFVVRKNVVDNLGLGFFKAVNNGAFGVAPAAPPSGAGAAAASGMAKGGLVSDQLQRASVASSTQGKDDQIQVLPAVVAGERQLDRMFAGGKSAARQFLQDNAGIIRSIAQGGR